MEIELGEKKLHRVMSDNSGDHWATPPGVTAKAKEQKQQHSTRIRWRHRERRRRARQNIERSLSKRQRLERGGDDIACRRS